eukprot:324848-Chlamydomonas_euryale.AAC.1
MAATSRRWETCTGVWGCACGQGVCVTQAWSSIQRCARLCASPSAAAFKRASLLVRKQEMVCVEVWVGGRMNGHVGK